MDTQDRLEQTEQEISYIGEAICYLESVRDCEDVIQILRDRSVVLVYERDNYRRRIEANDAREDAALEMEYWRSVI